MDAYGEFPAQFALAEDFDARPAAVGKPGGPQRWFVHPRAVVEMIEVAHVHGNVTRGVARVVEAALRNAADQRHLAAFKADAYRTARTRGLAFPAAAAGFAVAAGFALAKPLAAVLGAGAGFEIV